jgi:hypothetical protein
VSQYASDQHSIELQEWNKARQQARDFRESHEFRSTLENPLAISFLHSFFQELGHFGAQGVTVATWSKVVSNWFHMSKRIQHNDSEYSQVQEWLNQYDSFLNLLEHAWEEKMRGQTSEQSSLVQEISSTSTSTVELQQAKRLLSEAADALKQAKRQRLR